MHYLCTGTYQILKSQNRANHAHTNSVTEYTKHMNLYCVATRFGLSHLAELSKQDAQIYERTVSLAEFMNIAEDIFTNFPEVEIWLIQCLKKKMKVALDANKFVFTTHSFLEHIGKVERFNKAVVKCIAEIYAERDMPPTGTSDVVEVRSCLVEKHTGVEYPPSEDGLINVDDSVEEEPFTSMDDLSDERKASPPDYCACADGLPCTEAPLWKPDPPCTEDSPCAEIHDSAVISHGIEESSNWPPSGPPSPHAWSAEENTINAIPIEDDTTNDLTAKLVPSDPIPIECSDNDISKVEKVKKVKKTSAIWWPSFDDSEVPTSSKHRQKTLSKGHGWRSSTLPPPEPEVELPARSQATSDLQEPDVIVVISQDSASPCRQRVIHLEDDSLWSSCPSCRSFVEGVADGVLKTRT